MGVADHVGDRSKQTLEADAGNGKL